MSTTFCIKFITDKTTSDMEEATAHGIASGDLHPETGLPIEDQWPDYKPGSRPVVTRAISSPTRVRHISIHWGIHAQPDVALLAGHLKAERHKRRGGTHGRFRVS